MWTLLAQTDRDQAVTEGYALLYVIVLVGLVGLVMLLAVFVIRRYTQRRLDEIERDKAQRRRARSTGQVADTWQAGADRYVDHDKLPQGPSHDSDAERGRREDEVEGNDDETPPGWDEPDPDENPDPFGLFEDKPFREADEEEDEDDDDEDWDEEDDDHHHR